MNNYKDIMENLDDKSDIQTDEELLLFSETESEEEHIGLKKRPDRPLAQRSCGCPKKKPKS